MDDWVLLQDYVERNSEAAFRALVDRYLGLVRSVALRQVNDTQLAEEIIQAVFILLARKAGGFRRNTVLPGWLFRTTRFVAARALRAEVRRQRREQEAIHMQQLSSHDDAWRNIAPVLDEALEQLGETDRNAVILRFFQEQNSRSIGQALGLTEPAAKKRVTRALEKLRTYFARRGFTISATLLAGVLAEQGVKAGTVGSSADVASLALSHTLSGTASLPVLVHATTRAWRRMRIQMAVELGAVTTAIALLLFGAITPFRSPSHSAKAPGEATASMAADPADQSIAPDTTASNGSVKARSLVFRVMDALTERGIVGAAVHARYWHDWQVDPRDDLVTDIRGSCNVPKPEAGLGRLDIGVLAEGYVQKFVTWRPVTSDPVPEEYTLKLERGVSIGGWVRDELHLPIAEAEVLVQFAGTGDSDAREPERERLGFVDELPVTKTDPGGHWSCSIVPARYGDFRIEVRHPDFLRGNYRTDMDDHIYLDTGCLRMADLWAGDAVMVLKNGFTISGIVVDEQESPIAGAAVKLGRYARAPESSSKTTPDGAFEFRNVQSGTLLMTASASGFAPQQISVDVASQTPPVRLKLTKGALVRLRVVDDSASGVPHARVQVEHDGLDWGGFTDNEGRIEWPSAPPGKSRFFAYKEGYFYSRDNEAVADGQEHIITLHTVLKVSGRVMDAETGQPIPSFAAIPGGGTSAADSRWNRGGLIRGKDGQFSLTFNELPPPFLVRIEADGYEPAVSKPLDLQSGVASCDVSLRKQEPRMAVKGVVQLADGRPGAGAEVALCTLEKGICLGKARFLFSRNSIVTSADAEGRFSFPPHRDAHTVVAVHPEGFARTRLNDSNRTVEMQLQPWGRIEGVVRAANQPPGAQHVVLMDESYVNYRGAVSLDLSSYSIKTDSEGNFKFDQAPPGGFFLYLNPGIGKSFSHKTPVEVRPGETQRVQIGGTGRRVTGRFIAPDAREPIDWSKQVQFATLSSKVTPLPQPTGLDADSLERWKVDFWQSEQGWARMRGSQSFPVEVAADGSCAVDDVPPGTYILSAQLLEAPVATVDRDSLKGHRESSPIRHEITVLDFVQGTTQEPLDFGTLTFRAGPQKASR